MNQLYPLVSVIIPTYNRANMLRRAISSVLSQTFSDFELIVVDDASSDETEETIATFSDPRLRFIRHTENLGGAAARNTGLRAARGKYIAFLDSDDEWLPDKLEKQVQLLNNSARDVGAVYCGAVFIDDRTGKSRVKLPSARGNIYLEELRFNPVGSASRVLVRRECFSCVGLFDERLRSAQDWDMWIRISKKYLFDFVPDALVIYHEHTQSITSDSRATIVGRQMLWQKHGLLEDPDHKDEHFFRLGHTLAYWGHKRDAINWFVKAIRCKPWRVSNWVAALVSLIGGRNYRYVVFWGLACLDKLRNK